MRPQYEEVSRFETRKPRPELTCSFCGGPLESAAAPMDILRLFGRLLCDACQKLTAKPLR